jgi:glucoamylase
VATILESRPAPGGPGMTPHWTSGNKDGVGTAYSATSRVWFTVSRGVLTEVYYPTIDRPQIRDLQYLVTDGSTFFHDERDLESTCEYLDRDALGLRITNADPQGHYRIVKEVIADPHLSCVLVHTRFEADPDLLPRLRLFALLAPHLEVGGWGNNGRVVGTPSGEVLTAHKGKTWLALAASAPFHHCSCGYVGTSDGWQDLAANFEMNWRFDHALDGNIALTGEIDLRRSQEFVLALAFGESLHNALVTLSQALGIPFAEHRRRFIEQWRRAGSHLTPGREQCTGAAAACTTSATASCWLTPINSMTVPPSRR